MWVGFARSPFSGLPGVPVWLLLRIFQPVVGFWRQRQYLPSESSLSIPGELFVIQMQLLPRCWLRCSSGLFSPVRFEVSYLLVLPGIWAFPANFLLCTPERSLNKKPDWATFQSIFLYSVYPADEFTTVVKCDAIRKSMTSECTRGMIFPRVIYSAVRFVHCYNNLIYF